MSNNTIHDNRSTEGSPGWLMEGEIPIFLCLSYNIAAAAENVRPPKKSKKKPFWLVTLCHLTNFFHKLLFCFIEKTLWNCDWINYFQFIEQNEVLTMNYQVLEEEAFNPWVRQLTITKKMAADTHLFVLVTRLVTMLVTTFVQCSFADNQSGSGYGVLKFSSIKNTLSS